MRIGTGKARADDRVKTFLGARYRHQERHKRQVGKVKALGRRRSKEQP